MCRPRPRNNDTATATKNIKRSASAARTAFGECGLLWGLLAGFDFDWENILFGGQGAQRVR